MRRRGMLLIALACAACSGAITNPPGGLGGAGGLGGGGPGPGGVCTDNTVTLRRLTRTEYNNTVRDLLGDTSQPADGFPADSRNLGFDNNLVTLTTPPVLVVEYETAAEKLIEQAWARDTQVSATAWLRVCDPQAAGEAACAQQMVSRLARRAWRRPPAMDELQPFFALYDLARGQGDDFATGAQLALRALLISPNFVYRSEVHPPAGQPPDPWALAQRLSYFLWSSMPDDQLSQKADDGTLAKPDVLASEVRRMMADPKAQALVDNFAAQWLDTRDMPLVSPAPELYPGITTSLKQAMHDETALTFQTFLTEQRSALDLVDANFTFLNQELAGFYGVGGVSGDAMQRVTLPPDSNRGGILRQAGVLAVNSLPTRTSIVRRGKWVLSQLLCQAPHPPPPNIPPLPMQVPPGATQRELLEIHAANGVCASCHDVIDPFGFALENFDASGRYRTTENGKPIDASATLQGQSFDGAAQLEQLIKANPALPACMAEMAYTYAAGRSRQPDDDAVLSGITQRFLSTGGYLADLFINVATDAAFRGHCAP